jgi:tetratricopeptide (TPR) repeat protein
MSTQDFYISRPQAEVFLQDIDAALNKPETNFLLFHVCGETGVGKSFLLQKIKETYEKPQGTPKDGAKLAQSTQTKNPIGFLGWLMRHLTADSQNKSSRKSVLVFQASFEVSEGITDPIKLMKQLYDDLEKQFLFPQAYPSSKFISKYNDYQQTIEKLQTQPIQEKEPITEEQRSLVKAVLAGGVGFAAGYVVPGSGVIVSGMAKTGLDTIDNVVKAGLTLKDFLEQHQATRNSKDLRKLIESPIPILSELFAETLKGWSSQYSILLLFDAYEGVSLEVDKWLRQFLRQDKIQNSVVRFVVSSKQSLFRVQGGDWERFKTAHSRLVEELRLEPFERDQTQAYLRPLGVTKLDDIIAIDQFTKGLPYSLSLVRQKLQDEKKDGAEITQEIINKTIRELRSSRNAADLVLQGLNLNPTEKQQVRQVTQLTACCYSFYPKLVQYLMESQKLDYPALDGYPTWFEWLKQQSFVELIEAQYRLNSTTRGGLQQLLWQEDEGESAANIHASLAVYFKAKSDWEVSADSPLSTKYENPDWVRNRIRFIYHLLFSRQTDYQLEFLSHLFEGLYLQTDVVGKVLRAITAEADLKDSLLPYPSCKFLTQIKPAVEFSNSVLKADQINYQELQRFGLSKSVVDQAVQACLIQSDQLAGLAKFSALLVKARRCGNPEEGCKWLSNARDQVEKLVIDGDQKFNSNLFQEVGIGMLTLGQYNEAIEDFTNVIRLNPSYAYAYNSRGIARAKSDDPDGAIEDFEKIMAIDPDYVDAYNNRGFVLRQLNKLTEAIEDFTTAIRLSPNYIRAYNNRGEARQAANELHGAIEDFTEAIRLNPNDADGYIKRANAHTKLNDLPEAIKDFTEAIRLNPNDADAYNSRGITLGQSGDLAGAIEDFEKIMGIDPNYVNAYYNRGFAREKLGDLPGAIEDFTEAIELDPNYVNAYKNRAVAHRKLNNLIGAIEDFTEAIRLTDETIRLNPDDASAYYRKAYCLCLKGDVPAAIENLQQAIHLNPTWREQAKTDSDFDGIREDGRFQALVEA